MLIAVTSLTAMSSSSWVEYASPRTCTTHDNRDNEAREGRVEKTRA